MNRTVLVLVAQIGCRWRGSLPLYWCAIAVQVLVIALINGVVAVLFQPGKSPFGQIQRGRIARRPVVGRQAVDGEGVAVGFFDVPAFGVPLPVDQRIEPTVLGIPHLIPQKNEPVPGTALVVSDGRVPLRRAGVGPDVASLGYDHLVLRAGRFKIVRKRTQKPAIRRIYRLRIPVLEHLRLNRMLHLRGNHQPVIGKAAPPSR